MNGLEIDFFMGLWTTVNILKMDKKSPLIYLSVVLLFFLVLFYFAYVILTVIFTFKRVKLGAFWNLQAKIVPQSEVSCLSNTQVKSKEHPK